MSELSPFDIVSITSDFEDAEVRGKRGYIIGEVTETQIAVFVYDVERVWCLRPGEVKATGQQDLDAQKNRGDPIRVNQHGEIVD